MPDADNRTIEPLWRESRARRLAATLAYPLIRLLNRPSAAPLCRAIYDFALRCNGIAINFAGRHGLNLAEERLLARIAPRLQGGVILDVGANEGSYARALRRIAPTARIFAFEPHPQTFARLKAQLDGTGVEALHAALGDREGTVELYDLPRVGGSAQASLSWDAVALFSPEVAAHTVACTTLDAFLDSRGIEAVDYLKIDTEGFDLNVLRGARSALAQRRIRLIQFEFSAASVATRVRMRDFFDVLAGYEIHRLCLNGGLLPLFPYSVKHCEIYVNQNLIAFPAGSFNHG